LHWHPSSVAATNEWKREGKMTNSIRVTVFISTLVVASGAVAQGMLLDFAADKVIKKFTRRPATN
jgi:hypothetical protein